MKLKFQYKTYTRTFKKPFHTAYGCFSKRSGILIQLASSSGQKSYGEIAPLQAFGTESLSQAEQYCRSLPPVLTSDALQSLPKEQVCTRSAFQQAFMTVEPSPLVSNFQIRGLLSCSENSTTDFNFKKQQGYRHFKLKIGRHLGTEQAQIRRLLDHLPTGGSLALDANGSLMAKELWQWLKFLEPYSIAYLEQPLPVGQEARMDALHLHFPTPIALDESVTQACLEASEPFAPNCYLVIKLSLMPDWALFKDWHARQGVGRCLYSSAFETSIGIENTLSFIQALEPTPLPIGYNTLSYFEDPLQCHAVGPTLRPFTLSLQAKETIWNSLN